MPIPEYPAQSRREPVKGETVSPERRHLKGPFRGSAQTAQCDDIAPLEALCFGRSTSGAGSARRAIGKGGYQRESFFADDPLTALEVSVLRLNHRQQLITGRPDEVVRNCRQIFDPIFLRRSPRNELEFAEFITAFARLVYDGTNGVASVVDRGTVKPTLPSWCYRDHRSVIVHVIVLRNHYLHGLSPNATTAEEHLTSAGDVFELYVAKRLPDDEDFAAIRVGMLTAATRLVDGLAAHVPLRDAVDAEAVLTNPNGDGGEVYFLSQIGATNLEQNEIGE